MHTYFSEVTFIKSSSLAKGYDPLYINSLTDDQSKSITAIIDGKDVFVGTL